MSGVPACRSPVDLIAALPDVDDAARAEVDARPIDYALGSGEADEVGLFAGVKPLLRQLLDGDDVARARARFEALGLHVEEAAHVETPAGPRGGGRVLFIARDARRARAAALIEAREGHDVEMGLLLGYPRCCVEAYLAVPPPRRNADVIAAALARTPRLEANAFRPRLNVLDLAIFHYTSWLPCSFRCAPSLAYADAVANHIARRHGQFVGAARPRAAPNVACPPGCRHQRFVARVDAALAAHRLLLFEDVQVSIEGAFDGRFVHVTRAWPSARDRHPAAGLDAAAREAAARLTALVRGAGRVSVEDGVLIVDDAPVLRTPDALLAPFGAR